MTTPLGDGLPDDDPAKRVNDSLPGGVDGGVIETTKRAIVVALREALVGTSLGGGATADDTVKVDMEYPLTKERYPGVWVQFSYTDIMNSGLGQELLLRTVVDEGTPSERVNWEPVREFIYQGRVTLTVVALTSLQRDRIADAIVTMLMFSRPSEVHTVSDPLRDARQGRQFVAALAANPYVSLSVNHDMIRPGGQASTSGVPWDETAIGYEDNYSFDILGQANIVYRHDGTFTLRAMAQRPELTDPHDWH